MITANHIRAFVLRLAARTKGIKIPLFKDYCEEVKNGS